MASAAVETYYENGQWKNKKQGNDRAFSVHADKAPAESKGREAAKALQTEHIVKKMDGTIGHRNSYGPDPRTRRG